MIETIHQKWDEVYLAVADWFLSKLSKLFRWVGHEREEDRAEEMSVPDDIQKSCCRSEELDILSD